MWWISSWFILYSISIFALIFGIQRLRVVNKNRKTMSLDEITVVIPFRNEAHNLEAFLNGIKSQRYQPEQWVFVNDHSTDDFGPLFESMKAFPVRLLHLPDEQRGKKRAIRFGIDHVRTDYCLTMDADVVFGKEYIKSMLVMPEADMIILPVEMTSKRWWHPFFTLEYLFTTLLNRGVAGWLRPVNCSGANLLFKVSAYDEVDDIEDHDHVLSGDDMYALRAFRNAGKSVELFELASAKVSTPTPSTFSETMEQRVRWMNKTGNVGDNLNTFLGLWAVGLHLLFFLLLLLTWFGEVWWFTVLLLIIKTILDGSLIRMETTTFSKETIIGVLLFELFYPVYLVALLGSAMFHQPEWKGR
jgi:glycosyltransferase involved in cell wall biosynthesis